MDYALNLSWPDARALARQGAYIRRWDWTDRWIFRSAVLWWMTSLEGAFPSRIVRSVDFTRADRLAGDWTTMWPDQRVCLLPAEPPVYDDGPILPPEPTPTPEPAGPIVIVVDHDSHSGQSVIGWGGKVLQSGGAEKAMIINNPFAAPARVVVSSNGVDDYFTINGSRVSRRAAGSNFDTIDDVQFTVSAHEPLALAWRNPTGGYCGGKVTFTFYAN